MILFGSQKIKARGSYIFQKQLYYIYITFQKDSVLARGQSILNQLNLFSLHPPPLQSFAFAFESGHGRQHPVGHSVFQVL